MKSAPQDHALLNRAYENTAAAYRNATGHWRRKEQWGDGEKMRSKTGLLSLVSLCGWLPVAVNAASTESGQLEEVVVTAQRRPETVQNTPLAINVLDSAALERNGTTQLADLQAQVPSLNIGHGGPSALIYLRGVGNFSPNAFAETAIAVNFAGAYLGRPTGLNGMFYDLDQITVLKGPQGTLYGRNASAGVINLIPNRPDFNGVSGSVGLELGNYDLVKGSGVLNVPLNDTIAVRAAGQVVSRSGYLTDGYDDDKESSGRVSVLMNPADGTSLLTTIDYSHQGGKGSGSVWVKPGGGFVDPKDPWLGGASAAGNAYFLGLPGPPQNPIGSDQFQRITNVGVTVELQQDLGFANLTFLPAYRVLHDDYLTYSPGFRVTTEDEAHATSVETRLASKDADTIKWVAGVYYFKQRDVNHTTADQSVSFNEFDLPKNDTRSYAAFGEGTAPVTENLSVILGARYTTDTKSIVGSNGTGETSTTLSFTSYDESQNFYAFNYKAGLQYQAAPQSMIYATVSTGFKSGGYYGGPLPNNYRPEKLLSYAIGSKNRFLDNRLEINAEAYHWDYTNRQESHLGLSSAETGYQLQFQTINAGKATLAGLDVDSTFLLTPDDKLALAFNYMHTRYDRFIYDSPGQVGPNVNCPLVEVTAIPVFPFSVNSYDCSGRALEHAPSWSGTASYQRVVALPDGATLTGTLATQFSSPYYWAIEFMPNERQDAYMTTDFSLSYAPQSAQFDVTAYVKNLENKAIVSGGSQQGFKADVTYATLRPPRTYGVRFVYRFGT